MQAFEDFKKEYLQPSQIVVNDKKWKRCPFSTTFRETMIPLKTHTESYHKGLIKQSYVCEACGFFADFFEEDKNASV